MASETGEPVGGASALSNGDGSEADLIKEAAVQSRENALVPLVEDVAEWLSKVTGESVSSGDGFMESLDNGAILCLLIKKIQDKQANPLKEKIKYRPSADRGGWHARDNAATFILWCKHFNVKSEVLFESNGLVTHKQKREVVLCLLELSRFAARYGIEPPAIIKLEKEIEQDEKMLTRMEQSKPNAKGNKKFISNNKSKSADVDQEVHEMTSKCVCDPAFYVEKLTDGIYAMGNKRCLIRKLKDRHIMVRVGGGWDTLENYLTTHDPCRVSTFRKGGGPADMLNVKSAGGAVIEKGYKSQQPSSEERFLHVKGRYSSARSERKSTS